MVSSPISDLHRFRSRLVAMIGGFEQAIENAEQQLVEDRAALEQTKLEVVEYDKAIALLTANISATDGGQ